MITVACVWVGTKYSAKYVVRLRSMVRRHLSHPHKMVCLTDRADVIEDVEMVRIDDLRLSGWWAKMALFNPPLRGDIRCLYFDLDTVICGSIDRLATYTGQFAICKNFTRLAGHESWPCRYGSCVMVFGEGWGRYVWDMFDAERQRYMTECLRGDQQAVEAIVPDAELLHDFVPEGFFLGYRDLQFFTDGKPSNCSVVIFAGGKSPDNFGPTWVKDEWVKQ